jgi:hypothetical protein
MYVYEFDSARAPSGVVADLLFDSMRLLPAAAPVSSSGQHPPTQLQSKEQWQGETNIEPAATV